MAPRRQVFGRRPYTKHDAFAAMLNSSPDVLKSQTTITIHNEHRTEHTAYNKTSSCTSDQSTILREVSSNALCNNTVATPKRNRTAASHINNATSKARSRAEPSTANHDQKYLRTSYVSRERTPEAPKVLPCSARKNKNVPGVAGLEDRMECDVAQTRRTTETKEELGVGVIHCDHSAAQDMPTTTPIDVWAEHCAALLRLSSSHIEDFAQWSADMTEHLNVTKIAEASFGEVFRLSLRSNNISTVIPCHDESVLKIIALTPPAATVPLNKRSRERVLKKISLMSKPEDVASEAQLLQRMSSIPGFTNFRDMRVLKGRPTTPFINAYKSYNRAQKAASKEPSHFPNPALKTSYSEDQLWAVIEMQDAGTDLERLLEKQEKTSVWTVWDIFWRVTLALAKGEESAEFEHRDLHLGNICVQGDDLSMAKQQTFDLEQKLGFTDVEITLIDYTISRATLHADRTSEAPQTAYFDLANDEHIFNGDSSEEYQYDIYRYMRSALFLDDAMAPFEDHDHPRLQRSWSQYHPQTNVIWLHYVLHMLLMKMERPSARPAPSRKIESGSVHARWRRGKELELALKSTADLLNPAAIVKNGLKSAGGLVTVALSNNWLGMEDVIGGDVTNVSDDLVGGLLNMTLHG